MEGNTENIAVNMNVATLSQIELLVDLGYYSDTNDFINQSVRQALEQKQSVIENEAYRHHRYNEEWFTGIYVFTENQLIRAKETGKKIKISGYGIVVIDNELDELAIEAIESIDIKGKVIASDTVKEHFSLR
ncbi:hypothetical protein SAMN02745229_03417 [Butyrivibrio fibrisolvens DSM 3071]|uniref:CopG family transcriptional regulator n=1 Tax=Butyrivibrio fibrisolvens DSM 3071 TaxID=1121131 RepID=A0A1M6CY55_BUTFI|nr:hypothetical protein [Butyrivibrio fibrisolvens]SHI66005.1 hypothetical protein SAMN02745229_03417 [Butyrivibrio fibrisolvens DSM 3071]